MGPSCQCCSRKQTLNKTPIEPDTTSSIKSSGIKRLYVGMRSQSK